MQSLSYVAASNGVANASLMTVQTARSANATSIITNTVANAPQAFYATMGTPHTFTDPVTGETITIISEATAVDFAGHLLSGHVEIDAIAPGYTDNGSKVGDIIIIRPNTEWANNIFNVLSNSLQDNGALKTTALDAMYKPSEITSVNFVASGGLIAATTGLNASFSDLVYYINGLRYTKTGVAARLYTASKDTYVDIGVGGVITYTEVATGGVAAPPLAANTIRLAKVMTNTTGFIGFTQFGNDSLGNPYRPLGSAKASQFTNDVKFSAYESNGMAVGVSTVILFNNVNYNHSNAYNPATGLFTAPYDGYYHFQTNVQYAGLVSQVVIPQWLKNAAQHQRFGRNDNASGNWASGNGIDVYLMAGDTFSIGSGVQGTSRALEGGYSYFTGHMISRT